MNILIDYTQIPLHRVGVGNYAYNTVQQLALIDQENQYYIVVQDDDDSLEEIVSGRMQLIKVKHSLFRKFPLRILLEQLYLPYLIAKHRIDIVHSLHFSFPLLRLRAKNVITFHDMTFFLPLGVDLKLKVYYFRLFIYLSFWLRAKLICVSETTREDLLKFRKLPESRLAVAPLGKSERFHTGYAPEEIAAVKAKYGITTPYFLFIGTIEPRKNLIRLINAFHTFHQHQPTHTLVITGKGGWGFAEHYKEVLDLVAGHGIADRVIFTGYISEAEKPLLISGCDVFTFPSIYEGFGIPIVEAMACGVPVITSNVSSMPEVGGDAAMYVDPLSEAQILQSLFDLAGNTVLKKEMIAKGLVQAARYTWRITAEKTLQCYRDTLGENRASS